MPALESRVTKMEQAVTSIHLNRMTDAELLAHAGTFPMFTKGMYTSRAGAGLSSPKCIAFSEQCPRESELRCRQVSDENGSQLQFQNFPLRKHERPSVLVMKLSFFLKYVPPALSWQNLPLHLVMVVGDGLVGVAWLSIAFALLAVRRDS